MDTDNSLAITIDHLEALAAQHEETEQAERQRLHRLIRAFSRILAIREPGQFVAMPLEHSDEDGHYDNSYPPKQVYKDHRGPKLIETEDCETTDIATSSGYYHTWRRETVDPGLFVARDGSLYGCTETGAGRYGQFAAHPGDCDVMCTLAWDKLALADIPMDRLQAAEKQLRVMAFPVAGKS